MKKHTALLASGLMALSFSYSALAEYAGELDQPTALSRIKQGTIFVLDVRSPQEYAQGHVPKATNVPHSDIEDHLDMLNLHKDEDILIYCKSGRRAEMAEEKLAAAGFKNVYHLKGDMKGWEASGMMIER